MTGVMTDTSTLTIACFRISNGASAVKGKPKRLKVLNWGDNQTKKGLVKVGTTTAQKLPVNQLLYGFDRVALDYEHNTVPGTPEYLRTTEPRKVAAYGVPLVIPGDGLYMDDLIYTPSGEENALEFIDLSGAVSQDENGEVVFMHSTALCRHGAALDVSYYSITINPTEKDTNMELKDVVEKLDSALAQIAALQKVVDGMKPSDVVETLNVSRTVAGQVTAQGETLKTLAVRLDGFERKALLDKATNAGKVIPLSADEMKTVDLTTLSAMIDKLPVTVPLHRRTPDVSVELKIDGKGAEQVARAAKIGARAKEIQATGVAFPIAFSMAEQEFAIATV